MLTDHRRDDEDLGARMMEIIEVDGYYLPAGLREGVTTFRTEVFQDDSVMIRLKVPIVTKALVQAVADQLKKNREEYLAQLSIERIISVLDEASKRWLDRSYPLRKLALQTIPVISGFSREVVEESIDVEMESSLGEDMRQALCSEIVNPRYLDDFEFSEELNGFRRAFGPELILAFFSQNIPALPHLLFMRSALVKAACLGKVAAGEPTFAPLYLKTIEEIDPEMAGCMAVLYWPGGEAEVEDAAFEQTDAVIVFGGVETCNSLMERIPRRIRVLVHGHKMGFGVIGREAMGRNNLKELAAAIAYDHAMFDQHACLAPHCYYVEYGGEVTPQELARAAAGAMREMNVRMPRGTITPRDAAVINQLRGRYEFKELKGEDCLLFSSPHGTEWTIIYERDPGIFSPSPLNRVIRIWGVEDIFHILPALRSLRPFLQNAAVAVGDGREKELIQKLGHLGVSRVTAPGKMPVPSMMWRHDGITPLAMLLRWCDVEKKDAIEGMRPKKIRGAR
jgi:hypothetical protein